MSVSPEDKYAQDFDAINDLSRNIWQNLDRLFHLQLHIFELQLFILPFILRRNFNTTLLSWKSFKL